MSTATDEPEVVEGLRAPMPAHVCPKSEVTTVQGNVLFNHLRPVCMYGIVQSQSPGVGYKSLL